MRVRNKDATVQLPFRNKTVQYNISNRMDKEQHRRIIGNSKCILIFYEPGPVPYNLMGIDELGIVPQLVVVVQPHSHDYYRIASFRRTNLKEFGPPVPHNFLFHRQVLYDYLNTKIYNGISKSLFCQPMRSTFMKSRRFAINNIAERYAYSKKGSKRKNLKKRLQRS
eukprot:TRINITY_DN1315_c0_g1_i2.p2 TRINITY_DN1315_c0_g1~~TRINITY_DN1315_c0_g1_i2.p2  ORF type:complete len:167 (-),score=24.91 TRINITY_DN1315_c0_g1_i2:74-574(-)